MRLPAALLLALGSAALAAPAAAESSGGVSAPPEPSSGGGTAVGDVVVQEEPREPASKPVSRKRRSKRARRPTRGPLLSAFRLRRPRLFLYGRSARVDFRVESRSPEVRVRLYIRATGRRRPVSSISLGERATGVTHSVRVTGRESGILPQGSYRLRIAARDRRGRPLRRTARAAAGVADLHFLHHRFPLVGAFDYGGAGSRFGAPRSGHSHQGQDLAAVEGTPVVAPRGGIVKAVQYQASGAGHYVVLGAAGEGRDYVFMHLRSGSIPVREGQRVRTGQRLGQVGNTGRSFGAHLHFEVWVGGGWYSGGRPIDPLPLLRAWDRRS